MLLMHLPISLSYSIWVHCCILLCVLVPATHCPSNLKVDTPLKQNDNQWISSRFRKGLRHQPESLQD
ncbi:hypothetical protein M758_3G197900 [Ceratodon purpureus]|uniref:Secreted protein n=1 Tax=Ceratodon purpureus TaxID=3225 RepID=A0A8T0ILZ0_CERPU|nr:hypothetical protein KC19_3G198600 [Ceratodon purpureus]KAG0623738.1 hypothetical protein M758_3G197900 [Ceratodon purpureus]